MFEKRTLINQSKIIIFIFQNKKERIIAIKDYIFFILKHLVKKLFTDDSSL